MVDEEVVAVELVLAELGIAAQRDRLDRGGVAGGVERDTDRAGAVSGVGQDLQARFLTGSEQVDAARPVTGVSRGQRGPW